MQGQRITRLAISALILVLLLLDSVGVYRYSLISQLEKWTYDFRLNFTRPDTLDSRIVIIDIDENSLAEVGHWPWGRDKLAAIIDNLFNHYQASVVGFDVVFAEKDQSSGLAIFEELAQNELRDNKEFLDTFEKIRPSLQNDTIFARSLKNKKVVMGYYFKARVPAHENSKTGALPTPVMRFEEFWSHRLPIHKADGYTGNLQMLQEAAFSGGFFDNPYVDQDGKFRRVPLLQAHKGQLYPSLALATTLAYLDSPQLDLVVETDGDQSNSSYFALEALIFANYRVPVDANGAAYVPFRGLQGSFPYISAHKVLSRSVDPKDIEGKIVLIGTSAPGLLDLRSTPVQNVYPGVEIHANIISGILSQTINHKPAWAIGYEFIILIVITVLIVLLLQTLSPLMVAVATLGLLVCILGGTLIAWQYHLILPLSRPILLTLLLFVWHMAFGFFVESRGKRQLAKLFGHYIPPELVDEMSASPSKFSLDGETREMTVLFSDVRGFTNIAEAMDPKQLARLMNALLTPMTRVIHKHRGTIDKYMGDAIMSFWGAPIEDSEHAHHALYAAMEMIQELKRLQADFKAQGWPALEVGIGVNTGKMHVGNMGSEFRMAYTTLGDAVNLGSRIESLTKNYGVNIIISESTKNCITEFVYRELDLVRVKGKNEPVSIFEPLGHINDLSTAVTSELSLYKEALQHFRRQNWDQAELAFFNLNRADSQRLLYQIYLSRIVHYRKQPPGQDWDGVFTHTSK